MVGPVTLCTIENVLEYGLASRPVTWCTIKNVLEVGVRMGRAGDLAHDQESPRGWVWRGLGPVTSAAAAAEIRVLRLGFRV